MSNEEAREKLIFALDMGRGFDEAMSWVRLLTGHVGLFKVGKEAFTRFGPRLVEEIQKAGSRVFLDLKFHDIPNTVARAAEGAVEMGVPMFNVHALGGMSMMAETAKAVRETARKRELPEPVVLGVTVLTSLNDDDLRALGFSCSTAELVLRLARMARDAGLSGVVASAQDVEAVRQACGEGFAIVTPGIRGSARVAGDDQKRVLSAEEAIRRGSDYLVVGRPIQTAEDPVAAADELCREIARGLTAG
ncbi:MAG: orotidine-5'-phosphate decarboxylase [Syntrophus sp. (in: bacteria)]|nr:orotidine-5'-phosphate decarboxylase [Syntrophus sp. (in: bacteria)]